MKESKKTLLIISATERFKHLLELKQKDLTEIVEETQLLPEHCINIKNSKQGFLQIKKISDNPGYMDPNTTMSGWCACFGEGLSARIDYGLNYYYTSNVLKIDWDKKEFQTYNSVYSFELEDYSVEEMLECINGELNSKHKETE